MDKATASPLRPSAVSLPATVRCCTLLAAGTVNIGNVIITGDCLVCGHITASVTLHEGNEGQIDSEVTAVSLDGSLRSNFDSDIVEILENVHLVWSSYAAPLVDLCVFCFPSAWSLTLRYASLTQERKGWRNQT